MKNNCWHYIEIDGFSFRTDPTCFYLVHVLCWFLADWILIHIVQVRYPIVMKWYPIVKIWYPIVMIWYPIMMQMITNYNIIMLRYPFVMLGYPSLMKWNPLKEVWYFGNPYCLFKPRPKSLTFAYLLDLKSQIAQYSYFIIKFTWMHQRIYSYPFLGYWFLIKFHFFSLILLW